MTLSKAFHPFAVIHDLKRTVVSIREQWRSARRENTRLRKENEQWRERAERLERERVHVREVNKALGMPHADVASVLRDGFAYA